MSFPLSLLASLDCVANLNDFTAKQSTMPDLSTFGRQQSSSTACISKNSHGELRKHPTRPLALTSNSTQRPPLLLPHSRTSCRENVAPSFEECWTQIPRRGRQRKRSSMILGSQRSKSSRLSRTFSRPSQPSPNSTFPCLSRSKRLPLSSHYPPVLLLLRSRLFASTSHSRTYSHC